MSGQLHIFSGNDDFSIKENAAKLIRKLCGESPEDNPSLEIIRGDSDTEKYDVLLDQLINSVTTPPFLTPDKIIWLRHFNKFEDAFSEPSDKKRKSRLDHIAGLFKDGLMDNITVVIDGPGIDRKRVFYKTCAAVCQEGGGTMNWFEKIDPKARDFGASMTRKVQEMCAEAGKKISPDAATFLAETSGGDLPKLRNELDKLFAYTEGRPGIALPDCHAVCTVTPEALSWEFSGALAERNAAKAISLIPGIISTLEQGSSGKVELAILGAVSSEFKKTADSEVRGGTLFDPEQCESGVFRKSVCRFEKQRREKFLCVASSVPRVQDVGKCETVLPSGDGGCVRCDFRGEPCDRDGLRRPALSGKPCDPHCGQAAEVNFVLCDRKGRRIRSVCAAPSECRGHSVQSGLAVRMACPSRRDAGTSRIRWLPLPRNDRRISFFSRINGPSTRISNCSNSFRTPGRVLAASCSNV